MSYRSLDPRLIIETTERLEQRIADRFPETGLRKVGEVKLNEKPDSLEGDALIAAAQDCGLIVSYRQSPAPAALFDFLRLNHARLERRHGGVVGVVVPRPRLLPVEDGDE